MIEGSTSPAPAPAPALAVAAARGRRRRKEEKGFRSFAKKGDGESFVSILPDSTEPGLIKPKTGRKISDPTPNPISFGYGLGFYCRTRIRIWVSI